MTVSKDHLPPLTEQALKATMRDIARQWVDEGFTTPPYSDAIYDLFEYLEVPPSWCLYDIRRPKEE